MKETVNRIVQSGDKLAYAVIMLVAIPEWFVFAGAYISTFVNVLRRPEPGTSKLLALLCITLILLVRSIYLIYFMFILPDDSVPGWMFSLQRTFLYGISAWWMLILCGPALCGVLSWLIHGVGNTRLTCEKAQSYHKRTICVLPVYNEEEALLVKGIESIVQSDFPSHLLEIHVSFDDEAKSDLWKAVVRHFSLDESSEQGRTVKGHTKSGVSVFVHRWDHGGKRSAQANTWHYIIDNNPEESLVDSIFILTDSDNIMLNQALNNLSLKLHQNPRKIAYAGYMSCMSRDWNFMRFVQDTEYVSNELNRFFELSMGTVNCLPGGFTAIRYSALARVAPVYFARETEPIDTITLYHMRVLGEDRYLTHLVHKEFPRFSIGFCPLARCKTDPPSTVFKYIQQRRRWLLGSVANEAYMITTPSLWLKFPALLVFKIIQTAWRSTSFSQFLIIVSAIQAYSKQNPGNDLVVYATSIGVPVLMAWIAAMLAGIALKRFKVCLMWPFMLVTQTVLQIFIDFYALFTWRRKTWGGPRVLTVPISKV